MIQRTTKLRWRRRVKRSQRQVEQIGVQAEQGLEKHVIKRLGRFVGVRRFIFGWITLFVLIIGGLVVQTRALSRFYQVLEAGDGGIYTEGIVGSFSNANPIYAADPVDLSVSRLVFSGLLKYDVDNSLVNDLASQVQVDETGKLYTISLKENAYWHDGEQVTAEDIVFTYHTIQKPDAQSPLLPNWQKVKVEALGKFTVQFTLPHPLASFPNSLTNGIVPEHILADIPATELRGVPFNTVKPVGSGIFKWDDIDVSGNTTETRQEQIGLTSNDNFYDGAPNLERFVIKAFHDQGQLLRAFEEGSVNGAAGLEDLPATMAATSDTREFSVPLTSQVAVFFKTSEGVLKDKTVRAALAQATDRTKVSDILGYPVILSKSPLLSGHIGYDASLVQAPYNLKAAGKKLDQAGWKVGKDGVRVKSGKELTFKLYTQDNTQFVAIANELQNQYKLLGVRMELELQPDTALQSSIAFHSYDALLYGISIGPDPDVYAYWHSSQADPRANRRLNFSEYKSDKADAALEAGRSRSDPKQRAAKYKPFLQAWMADSPAVSLYQPRYLYVVNTKLYGFEPKIFNNAVDRYANVQNWAVRQERVDIY